ncbi:hypothetical protein F4804DRAFT_175684 [Jackrogersella minutella]|nr:hypothetical protein F4804DRAFT_175684 [Jackrogersella minutella]
MAPQKPRCTFKECRSAAQRIVGDCGFCEGHFCAKHRLLEDHKCSGLEDVSMNPTPPSESSDGSDFPTAEWWLVGLGDYLKESGLDKECCGGSHMLTSDPERSARRNRTSVMQPNSRRNERRSSGVYKKRSAPSSPPTSHRRSTSSRRRPRRHDRPLTSSKCDSPLTTTNPLITHDR